MDVLNLLGSTMGLALTAGINLYATVLTVGLCVRFDLLKLNPDLAPLEVLAHPAVLVTAGVFYLAEFAADKIPWVDSAWDAVHTLIRPLGAAALGATALGAVDPATSVVAALVCGGVALSGHSTKAGLRFLVNHSPEPFTNVGLSLAEDTLVVAGAWLAVSHPMVMLAVVMAFCVLFALLAPKILRLAKLELLALWSLIKWPFTALARASHRGLPHGPDFYDGVPEKYAHYARRKLGLRDGLCRARCVAGKGVKGLRHSIGYIYLTDDGVVFVARRLFRFRSHRISRKDIRDMKFKRRLLFDHLVLVAGERSQSLLFFKDSSNSGPGIFDALRRLNRV